MEFIVIAGTIIGAVVLYFSLGIVLKFIWGWWMLLFAVPFCGYIAFAFGWFGAVGGIVGFCASLVANNEWHDSPTYLAISQKIDKAFYFEDT